MAVTFHSVSTSNAMIAYNGSQWNQCRSLEYIMTFITDWKEIIVYRGVHIALWK